MPTDSQTPQDLYDITLQRIDTHSAALYFAGGHLLTLARRDELRWWRVGEIGVLRLGVGPHDWGWRPYPDQRLRRAPERDDPESGQWAWRLIRAGVDGADDYLLTKKGEIPGANGAFVGRNPDTVSIDLPREFRELCLAHGQSPAAVLQAFMADVGTLASEVSPRDEDGDRSVGRRERQLAQDYFTQAIAMGREKDPVG
jgi:hypothetical protein